VHRAHLRHSGPAQAQWPYINAKLTTKQVTIRKAVVLPAVVDYHTVSLTGVKGGTEKIDPIANSLHAAVSKELSLRGVEAFPNPLETAKTDAERYAIPDLQTRYDSVRLQLRKKPRWVERGKITLDDRVARFAPALGSDALVFIRGRGQNRLPVATFSLAAFTIEVSLVDARTGEVLAFVGFGLVRDVTHNAGDRLARGFARCPVPVAAAKS
jgi:hypothetical protein